jgi:hypothetical protein
MMLTAVPVGMSQEMFPFHTWAPPGLSPRRATSFRGGEEARDFAYRFMLKSFNTLYIDQYSG